MRWFKHITTSLDDPFIFELIHKFGGDGYLVFFGTLETMSREFDINSPGICQLSFNFLRKKLQLSARKVTKTLDFCEEKGRIWYTLEGDNITLNCPKLKDLCDEWTKKQLRSKSVSTPPQELEVELEVEVDKEKDTNIGSNLDQHSISFEEFWEAYPKRNGKKIGKTITKKKFFKLKAGDLAKIIVAVYNYSDSENVRNGYAKDPERFFTNDFWKDWAEPEEKDPDPSGPESDMQKFMRRQSI